ncbi:MAG: molecular chaperone DnaK [Bradymonadia bacterium]
MSDDLVIGIDLGTTNSCVSAVVDGSITVFADEDGNRIQRSMTAFMPDGTVVVGNAAQDEMVHDPINTVYSAKRLIGRHFDSKVVQAAIRQFPFDVVRGRNDVPLIRARGADYGLPEIAGMVLRRMRDIAEMNLGHDVRRAVITVPANFNDTQRQMTKLAGGLAGLDVMRVINEPTAAALAYGYGRHMSARIAVYDFGGGTFDITLLEVRRNVFEVLSTAGDTYLGGDDFDNRLTKYMLLGFQQQHGFPIEHDIVAVSRLKRMAEQLKCELSSRERATVNVRNLALDASGQPCDLTFQVDRKAFDERCGDIVKRTFTICDEALRAAGLKARDLDAVVLVGGSTRIPLVRQMVSAYFGRPAMGDINPVEVVAIGAAIQGTALNKDPFEAEASAQPLLIDVTPMSLGVRTVHGFFEKLINANTSIPCEETRTFTTAADMQSAVRLQIYQGESNIVEENTKLGELELYDLRPLSRGQVVIDVTFEVDTNGIILVTARDQATGMEQATRLSVSAGYDDDDVAKMLARAPDDAHE